MANCIVVKEGNEALIVDPGEAPPRLFDMLKGYTVRTIVNTHGHCDHCGGNAEIVLRTGAQLAAHPADLELLRHITDQGHMFGVPFPASPDPDWLLAEGDTVSAGKASFTVLHTPGHSPGHIVLIGHGVAIVGDVLFAGSIGRADLPGGNHMELLHSIQAKLLTLPDDTVVYPGHGPCTTIGAERASNPFLAGL